MIKFDLGTGFINTLRFLNSGSTFTLKYNALLKKYGEKGVAALKRATPVDEGNTADGWSFYIEQSTLYFTNNHIVDGFSVALGLQYGHGTRNGGYVPGMDYINPELSKVFDELIRDFDGEVSKL